MTRDDDAGLGVTFSPYPPRGYYLIWSLQHAAWWAPAENGYTRVLAAAGRYSHADALRIVERANFALVHECAIPVECVE
jgi:hypothetical protein